MLLKKLAVVSILVSTLFYQMSVEANLVDTLRATSLCSVALKSSRQQILEGKKAGQIDCLTLQNYFATIDAEPSHRSFDRARALVNAQRIVKILAKYSGDVSQLQRELDSAFDANFRALKQLTRLSVLARYRGMPSLKRGEQIFFFGLQKMDDGLYVLEGRKSSNKAKFVGKVIQSRTAENFPTTMPFLALRVGTSYISVPEIVQHNYFQNVYGFYIKNLQIVIPPPDGSLSVNDLYMMGREIAAILDIPVDRPRATEPYGPITVGGNHNSDSSHSDDDEINSCDELIDVSSLVYKTTGSLNLRDYPGTEGEVLGVFSQFKIVYPLKLPTGGIWQIDDWICVRGKTVRGEKKGWVHQKYLTPID